VTVHIALLRAINVAGRNPVAMADLRDFLSQLGFHEPRSLLQSGNLVFRCDARSTAALERTLEAEAASRLGLDTDFFVRSAAEWKTIVASNPFTEEARRDPQRLLLVCLRDAPPAANVKALREAIVGREVIRTEGRAAYIVYPDGVGRSKLTTTLLEKKLGTRGTGRNWNTVLKLAAAAQA
jgi:uncharacterized protein (DUF1697 family)